VADGTPSPASDIEAQLELVLARAAHALLVEEGHELMFDERINQASAEVNAPEHILEHVLGTLEAEGLIWQDRGYYRVLGLALQYELKIDREEFRRQNRLRREALRAAARAFETENQWAEYAEPTSPPDASSPSFTDVPYAEAAFAVHSLEFFGLVELREFLGRNFEFKITPAGYDLARDEAKLRAAFPITQSEDEEAGAVASAFISYAHEDQEFVLALVHELEAQGGLEIRYDQVALNIGDSLIRALADEIANGDFLIAIVSPDSVESEWCQKELALAATQGINERRIKVLPVRYRSADMPPMLGDTYWGDADNDDILTLARRLAAAMTAQLGGAGDAAATEAAEAVRDGGGAPAHAEIAGDALVAQLDEIAQRLMDLLHQWEKCRAGAPTDDLTDKQRRLRWELDSLPKHVCAAMPLITGLADAEWQDYFRVVEPANAEPELHEELRSVRTQVAQGLPIIRRWTIVDDYGQVSAGNRDAVAYLWEIARTGDDNRRITVYISGTAMASDNSGLPQEVAAAKDTHGRSVLTALIAVDDPPPHVMVSTAGISWTLPD
jgi:hypothetical protein